MSKIQCCKCGKFIADKDVSKCKAEDVWVYSPTPELNYVDYWCLKCGEKEASNDQD